MNALRKKSAVGKVNDSISKQMTIEEAMELLKQDEAAYTAEELTEIEAEVRSANTAAAPAPNAATPPVITPPAPEAKTIDLSGFDYKKLTGKKFKEYVELVGDRSFVDFDKETGEEKHIVGKLKENDMHDFQLFKVKVVMKARFPGVKDSPQDFNGIEALTDVPEHTTRIPVRTAHELNAQILNAHSRAGHGKYYLLKK